MNYSFITWMHKVNAFKEQSSLCPLKRVSSWMGSEEKRVFGKCTSMIPNFMILFVTCDMAFKDILNMASMMVHEKFVCDVIVQPSF
jgi:hypothetical protein